VFFFQAEDGIRDYKVTGVQTCALPIFRIVAGAGTAGFSGDGGKATAAQINGVFMGMAVDSAGNLFFADNANNRIRKISPDGTIRSEERRVGKEWRDGRGAET